MKTAILTGHTGDIGNALQKALKSSGFAVEGWSRSSGVDVLKSRLPEVKSCNLLVHVAETGPEGLRRVWDHAKSALKTSHGALVYISSISAVQDQNPYATSKRSQEAMLRQMANEAAPKARVNCLRLGHVLGTRHWPMGSKIKDQALLCFVTLEDVARAVVFLGTFPTITGQIVTVDAGSTL